MPSIRLGIVGKGGVGKTTVAGLVARAYVERGQRFVAIDTDSNPNLGLSLGLTLAETEDVPVLPRSIIVGTGGSTTADPLIAEYGRDTPAGPTLLSAIRVAEAGAGCTRGGHATVRGMLADALSDVDVVLVDMEAGLEHLSPCLRRRTAGRVRAHSLVRDHKLGRLVVTANRVRDEADVARVQAAFPDVDVVMVPDEPAIVAAERRGEAPLDAAPDSPGVRALVALAEGLLPT